MVWRFLIGHPMKKQLTDQGFSELTTTNDVDNRLLPELSLDGISMIKVIPEKRVLIAPTVAQIVEHIQGKYFANADRNEDLVEHLLIGGLITEWGGNYFNRFSNQAVIVRGGRIDIQMSALNFPLNLLILTKNKLN